MALKRWTFPLEDGPHTLTFHDDPFWGRRRAQIDDGPWQRLTTARKSFSLDNDYALPIAGHSAEVLVRRIGLSYQYDCVVDGLSVETGLRPQTPPPFPAWGWVFVVLCGLLLTGGALGAVVGYFGLLFCYGFSRDTSQPLVFRVLICTGVTGVCWIVYLVLAALVQLALHPLRGR